MTARSPYSGSQRKLVLAFDVGTTFSGISYCILDPGEVPEIRGVTRYPAQELIGGDSKIPTIIYYDQEGKVRAVGAEAVHDGIEEEAEDGQWIKSEWFKLHLRPTAQSSSYVTHKIPPLPQGKSAIDVFADFLRYLYQCARTFIEETHANGVELWRTLKDRTQFVLTHPNGWEGPQQSMMRTAAVQAGLISEGPERVDNCGLSFVTEGEASLHFCVQNGLTNDAIQSGKGLLIVDAGGGTIDISAYRRTSPHSQSYEEIAAPQCHFHGSIFVTGQAKNFLDGFLGQSRFSGDIAHIVKCFDKTTKLRFRNADEPQYIKFGTIRDKDPKLNIRSGQLKLLGSDVASFFEPSVQCIVTSIKEQCEASATPISSVFLVGGFAASDWLYQNLKTTFASQGLDVSRPDSHVNKAVADGAVSFYIDHFVSARVSKLAYGVTTYTQYNRFNSEHKRRENATFITPEGYIGLPGIFSVVLPQNTKVSETQEFSQSYSRTASHKNHLETITVPIMCYRGDSTKSEKWMDEEKSMYSILCRVRGDTTELCKSLLPQVGVTTFYEMTFDVVLSLGLTELKAHICWEENGIERRSPAEVIYDPN